MTVAPADTVTFLLTPLREGRHLRPVFFRRAKYFYSRPCGRGDKKQLYLPHNGKLFLLTPLREGRPPAAELAVCGGRISTHAPAGGATLYRFE